MMLRRQFPTFERLYHWWNVRFTPSGKVISLLVLYSIPAILSFDDAMPFVGLCAVTVLLLTWLLGRRVMNLHGGDKRLIDGRKIGRS